MQSTNELYDELASLRQSDFSIEARVVGKDNPWGSEYQFEDRLDVLLGEDYYQKLRAKGLEPSKFEHDKIRQNDMVHLQWQEVHDYSTLEPALTKDVIYQVFASELYNDVSSHCAILVKNKRPLKTIKDSNHADLKRSLIPANAHYLNVVAIVSEKAG